MARFTSDMGRAAQQTEQAMGKMGAAVNAVKGALAALGVGVSVGAFAALVKGSIDAADNLRDMSMKTGIAVEALNGLGFAAGQAGGNLESMVASAGKLNKSIVEAAGGNKDVGEAFSKLGISVRDASGQLKSADVVMAEVADKFKTYEDGPQKAAIALRLFGKAGADMIPLLNDGGDAMRENIEYAKKYSGVTQELAEASDNFNDTMGKLAVQQKSFGNAMATAVLPVMQKLADEYLRASENSDKFAVASNVVRTALEAFVVLGSEVAFTFGAVGREIGALAAQADALEVSFADMAQGPSGIAKALASGLVNGETSWSKFTAISDAVKADGEKARKEHDEFIVSILDRTPSMMDASGISGEWDDAPKKPAAPTLRAKGDDPTKALLDGKLKALEDGYVKERDIAAFHDKYMAELRSQDIVDLKTYEQYKTASIEQALAAATRVYDAEIAVLQKARAAAAKETDRAEIDNKIRDKVALKEKARLDSLQALTMQTMALSAAQSDLNKSIKEWIIQQDQAASQFQFEISLYGKSAVEAAKLTAARRIYLDVEEKIRQKQRESVAPIDRSAFDSERDAAIARSNALYDEADAKQRDPWANMQESVRKYGEEASNTGAQIGNAMTNAFKGAEDAFVDFTMTGKLSFKSLASSVIADIARIQARKAIAGLINMAIGAYASQPSSGAGSTGWDGYGSTLAGARASGGPVSGGSSYLVGERGPEIFTPPNSGTIIPNSGIGGSGGTQITLNTYVTADDSKSDSSGNSGQARAMAEALNTKMKSVIMQEMRQGGIIWNQSVRG